MVKSQAREPILTFYAASACRIILSRSRIFVKVLGIPRGILCQRVIGCRSLGEV